MLKTGHLRLPNDLVETLARLYLSGSQWQVIWAVWRRTLCWQHPGDWSGISKPISITDLAEDTGLPESQVLRTLGELVAMNIVIRDRSPGGRGHKPSTGFNLNPSTWKITPANGKIKGSAVVPLYGEPNPPAVVPLSDPKGSAVVPLSTTRLYPFTNADVPLSVPESGTPKESVKETSLKEKDVIFLLIGKLYGETVGVLDQGHAAEIAEFCRTVDVPAEWVTIAFAEAAKREKRSWGYVRQILLNWKQDGGPAVGPPPERTVPEFQPGEVERAKEIWQATLTDLESQVSKQNYRTWLVNTTALGYRDGEFFIGVPNAFVSAYLQENQSSLIQKTLISRTQESLTVVFQVCENSAIVRG